MSDIQDESLEAVPVWANLDDALLAFHQAKTKAAMTLAAEDIEAAVTDLKDQFAAAKRNETRLERAVACGGLMAMFGCIPSTTVFFAGFAHGNGYIQILGLSLVALNVILFFVFGSVLGNSST